MASFAADGGAPVVASNGSGGAPPGRYDLSVSGTVHDNLTQLTWQQSVDDSSFTRAEADTYCAALSLDGGGWRLPTRAELESIIDDTHFYPAIDPTAFPGAPAGAFWTATQYVPYSDIVWYVDFYSGQSVFSNGSSFRLRCVR
jgi:hypothetical protein